MCTENHTGGNSMITYETNRAATTKSMTEWYFGKAFVSSMTAKA